jgi:hypothetical protein
MSSEHHPLFQRHPQRDVQFAGGRFALPLHVYECDMHIVSGTVDIDRLAELVAPHGVEPVRLQGPDGRAHGVAQLWLNDYSATSIGPYREFMISFSVAPPGSGFAFKQVNFLSPLAAFADPRCQVLVPWLVLDQPLAIAMGRAVWGFPKEPGHLEFQRTGERLHHCTRDAGRRTVVDLDLAVRSGVSNLLRTTAAMFPSLGLRRSLQLMTARFHTATAITPTTLKQARAQVKFTGWADIFPWTTRDRLTIGADTEGGGVLSDLAYTPVVVQHMPAVRFVMFSEDETPPAGPSA